MHVEHETGQHTRHRRLIGGAGGTTQRFDIGAEGHGRRVELDAVLGTP